MRGPSTHRVDDQVARSFPRAGKASRPTLRRAAKHLAKALVRVTPQKLTRSVLRAGALAPPRLKTPLFEFVFSRLAAMSSPGSRELIRTNLGISRKLRCDIPLDKPTHLFGRPENMLAERSALLLVAELVKDCKDFVDIGANEGLFTFFIGHAAAGIGARCHWFEPDDDLRERLIRNLAANGVAAQGNGVAVSDRKGSATFHKNLSDDSSGSLTGHFTGKHSTREIIVNTVTMSDYFRDQEIGSALVKIDVEGAGCAVWAGASAVADRITYLVMEMLAPEIESELPRKIIEAGFHAYYMRDFQLVEAPRGRFEYQAPFWNWLFSRLDPQRLAERLKGTRFQVVRAG